MNRVDRIIITLRNGKRIGHHSCDLLNVFYEIDEIALRVRASSPVSDSDYLYPFNFIEHINISNSKSNII